MTEKYKVISNEGKYSYSLLPDFKETSLNFQPCEKGLFFNDVFTLSTNNNIDFEVELIHSSIRSSTDIPGVLVINGNKTYGRGKNGKLLYKCIPDDKVHQDMVRKIKIKHGYLEEKTND